MLGGLVRASLWKVVSLANLDLVNPVQHILGSLYRIDVLINIAVCSSFFLLVAQVFLRALFVVLLMMSFIKYILRMQHSVAELTAKHVVRKKRLGAFGDEWLPDKFVNGRTPVLVDR